MTVIEGTGVDYPLGSPTKTCVNSWHPLRAVLQLIPILASSLSWAPYLQGKNALLEFASASPAYLQQHGSLDFVMTIWFLLFVILPMECVATALMFFMLVELITRQI